MSSGKRWILRAAAGRLGKSSSASWVDIMMEPFGHWTGIGLLVGRTLMRPTPWSMPKCEVVPVSMTDSSLVLGGDTLFAEGGPGGVAEELDSDEESEGLDVIKGCSSLGRLLSRGSPRPYPLISLVGVAPLSPEPLPRRRGLSSRYLLVSRGLRRIMLLPPFMLWTVASSW